MKGFCTIYFIFISAYCISQTAFTLSFDPGNNSFEQFVPASNGWVLLGTNQTNNENILIAKIDSLGMMEWSRTYSDTGMDWSLAIDNDGSGFIITGISELHGWGQGEVFILKIDSMGNLISNNYYPTPDGSGAWSIKKTSLGEYILAGDYLRWYSQMNNYNDGYVMKIDSSNNVLWAKRFEDHDEPSVKFIRECSDGSYVIAGDFMFVAKLDTAGNFIWSKQYTGSGLRYIESIEQTADSGFIVSGFAYYSSLSSKAFLLKLDKIGNVDWINFFGGLNNAGFSSAFQTDDGGFLASGTVDTNGIVRPFLVQTDFNGNIIWARDYLDLTSIVVGRMILNYDGSVSLLGANFLNNSLLLKIFPNENTSCFRQEMNFSVEQMPIQVSTLNYSMIDVYPYPNGNAFSIGTGPSAFLSCSEIIITDIGKKDLLAPFSFFQNPFAEEVRIKSNSSEILRFQIIDALGVSLEQGVLYPQSQVSISMSGSKNGVYFVRLFDSQSMWIKKLIKSE